ncbi:GPW/gp25 family protein [Streptomyces olivoreticuli]
MLNNSAIIGRGWPCPVKLNSASGAVELVGDEDEIQQSIRLILATRKGEREMRPEFGSDVHSYVFSPVDASMAGQLSYSVRTALERWEPRITVEEVVIGADDQKVNLLYVDILYRVRSSNSTRNLVFPFYTIPLESPSGGGL